MPMRRPALRHGWRTVAVAAISLGALAAALPPAVADSRSAPGAGEPEAPGVEALEWLESPRDARALEWAREQSRRSAAALAASPTYPIVLAELHAALRASAPAPSVSLLPSRAVRLLRSSEHPHGLLQVARRSEKSLAPWRTVLDMGALRRQEGKPYELQWFQGAAASCAPPGYTRCLLRLSPAGADDAELREFDLQTGRFVEGGFNVPATRVMSAWIDSEHVLIAHALGDAPRTAAGWGAEVRLWRRGEPLSSAKVVYRAEPTDAILTLARVGSRSDARGVVLRAIDYSTFELKLIDAAGRVRDVDLPKRLKPFGLLATTSRHLIVQLAEPWVHGGRQLPPETLIAYDASATSPNAVQVVYEPRAGEYLNDVLFGLASSESAVHFVVTRALVPRLITARSGATGWSMRDERFVAVGESLRIGGGHPAGDAIVVETAGLLTPTRQEILSESAPPLLVHADAAAFDASRFVVERRSATAPDRTPIDYLLLRPKRIPAGRPVSTLMTGYGAFGITLSPAYLDSVVGGRSLIVWLERGGALALPAIRGGGDRGAEWHRAAMREKRQVSYDDFAAVAKDLIESGFTARSHLGVFGSSNGGLLAASMGLQRPDLFGAVVSDVPLADMLRFPKMGMGAAWTDEYGRPEDPALATVLRSYSPLHLVRDGKKYPPFLVTVSTEDNRVGPGHARKLAARLQQAGVETYFLEDEEGGHGVSDPLARPSIMAKRMTFLIDRLMQGSTAKSMR